MSSKKKLDFTAVVLVRVFGNLQNKFEGDYFSLGSKRGGVKQSR